jgi:hypothetical protein
VLLPETPSSYVQASAVATGCAKQIPGAGIRPRGILAAGFRIGVAAKYRKKGTAYISLCALPFGNRKNAWIDQ